MNKTKVDDMLIEMISPRIKEIEEKFSRGEGLDQEDINTLLLKSQYNHINHLDEKLDEVTADVAGLKGEFKLLETNVNARFDLFEKNIELKISQAININMRWSIGMIAIIVTVLKLADMFVKWLFNHACCNVIISPAPIYSLCYTLMLGLVILTGFSQMDKRFEQMREESNKHFEQLDKQLEKQSQAIMDIHQEIEQQMRWNFGVLIGVGGLVLEFWN